MSYEVVIKSCKAIESKLSSLGATGKGLHEKLSSVEGQIEGGLVSSIRKLATIRNKLVHEDGYELSVSDIIDFEELSSQVLEALDSVTVAQKDTHTHTNNRSTCRVCDRDMVPRMIFENGAPYRSYCPHCGSLVQDFSHPIYFGESLYHLYLGFPVVISAIKTIAKVFLVSMFALIVLNILF